MKYLILAALTLCQLCLCAEWHIVVIPKSQESFAAESPKSRLNRAPMKDVTAVLAVGTKEIPDDGWHSRPAGDKNSCMIVTGTELAEILKVYPDAVYTDRDRLTIEMPGDVNFGLTTGDGDGGQISVLPSQKAMDAAKLATEMKTAESMLDYSKVDSGGVDVKGWSLAALISAGFVTLIGGVIVYLKHK